MIIKGKCKYIKINTLWMLFLLMCIFFIGCATDTKPTLHKYIEEGDTERAKELIYRRAYINAIDRDTNLTPLELAVKYDQHEIVRLLIEQGAYYEGESIIYAINNDRPEFAKLLIERASDIDIKQNYGGDVLISATKNHRPVIVKLLIEKGADVNAKNRFGWGALHVAAYHDENGIVELLLNKGAEVFEAEVKGMGEMFVHNDGYPAKVYDETIYANALLYRSAAAHSRKRSASGKAIERYAVAAINFKEASLLFNKRADSFGGLIQGNIVGGILKATLLFAVFNYAYEPGDIVNYDGLSSNYKTDSFLDLIKLKNIYTEKSNASNEAYLECKQIIKCYENSDKENATKCFK